MMRQTPGLSSGMSPGMVTRAREQSFTTREQSLASCDDQRKLSAQVCQEPVKGCGGRFP